MFCTKCGNEIRDDAVVCIHCGCSTQASKPAEAPVMATPVVNNDAPSTGIAVLGFFVPLAGLIIWLTTKATKPLFARSAGKGALIGAIVSAAIYVFYIIIYAVLIGSMMGGGYYY